MNVEQFAAARGRRLTQADEELRPLVVTALGNWGHGAWWADIVEGAGVLWLEIFEREGGTDSASGLAEFNEALGETLRLTMDPSNAPAGQVDRVTEYVGTMAVNDATYRAARQTRAMGMRWISMHDSEVRLTHRQADGQIVSVGGTFRVGEARLRYPGDPRGPLDTVMGCRCILAAVRRERPMSAEKLAMLNAARERLMGAIVADASEEEGDGIHVAEDDGDEELIPDEIPWHGVLAPMGVRSGDRRMFTEGALSNRELPLPLMYQRASVGEHNGAVQVGRIDRIEYYPEENPRLALGYGAILTRIPESDDVIAGAIDGALRGMSVDVDDVHEIVQELEVPDNATELELDEIRQNYVSTYDQARIMGDTIVAFPAFPEAYFTLGEDFQEGELDLILARLDGDEEALAAAGCVACDEGTDEYISEAPWDGDAANYTDEQWFRATLIHTNGDSRVKSDNKLPILTPSGELSRAGVHAAAARINQVDADPDLIARAKAALRAAYEDLGEDAPEVIAASAAEEAEESFARGPGWLTNPAGTRRIHDYWVRGKGALKIRWGTPGSFNRCRRQLAKYIQPQWLAGTCAQWYHEATGIWPGVKRGDKGLAVDGDMAPAFTIAASAERQVLPGEWFRDPGLDEPTPLTITDDGRVFGHVAQFGVCHIGIPGVCTTAPRSATDYAYYKVGMLETTDGMVTVGQITMDTGHADLRLGARPAAAHYDNTGVVVADVTVGEDDIGIWMAGAVRPSATEDQIERLRAAGRVSGDWRQIGGNLEMVGLLAVNVPGFPVPRTAVAASASGQASLVAAGIVAPEVEELDSGVDELAELVEQVTERVEERQARRARVAAAQEKAQGLRVALAENRSQRLERARAKLERI